MSERTFNMRLKSTYEGTTNTIASLAVEHRVKEEWQPLDLGITSPGFDIFVYAVFTCQHLYFRSNCAERKLLLDSAEGSGGCSRDTMIYLIIFSQLKRVADQAKNLAEQTVFIETGEAKTPKVYRVLFLDEDNSCLGPMAEMIAGKIYPDIGEYTSAGVHPADSLNANMTEFMQQHGFNVSAMAPQQLDSSRESLAHHHVIVGLHKKVLKAVVKIPFRTSALNWKDVKIPKVDDVEAWETLHRTLALHIRELMTLLRGDEGV